MGSVGLPSMPLFTPGKYSFRAQWLHSSSCLDCDLTGMLLSKCVRLIFNTTAVDSVAQSVACKAVFS